MRAAMTLLLILTISGCTSPGEPGDQNPLAAMTVPRYTETGELLRPNGVETWVFVGASIGLGYREEEDGAQTESGPGLIHNVQMQPEAYAHYARTGEFPEKTMFALTLYRPKRNESIARQGFFSGDFVALEVALKDSERFNDGWAYFDLGKDRASAAAKPSESCHGCHAAHGGDDNVFVQFYPVLRGLSRVSPGSPPAVP
jgi:hypothetical protein